MVHLAPSDPYAERETANATSRSGRRSPERPCSRLPYQPIVRQKGHGTTLMKDLRAKLADFEAAPNTRGRGPAYDMLRVIASSFRVLLRPDTLLKDDHPFALRKHDSIILRSGQLERFLKRALEVTGLRRKKRHVG